MNAIWSRDAECAARALAVRTFAVIPLSPFTGLLEWVDETEPIKAVLEGGHKRFMRAKKSPGLMALKASTLHQKWLQKGMTRADKKLRGPAPMYYRNLLDFSAEASGFVLPLHTCTSNEPC